VLRRPPEAAIANPMNIGGIRYQCESDPIDPMLIERLRRRITGLFAWRPGRLARGTLAMTVGMGLRTLAQAGVFLIVARVLGIEAYGAYAAVLALAGGLGSFAGFGVSVLMLRDTARDADVFAAAWGRTLAALALTAPVLFLAYGLTAWAVLPAGISRGVVALIGAAELVFAPLASTAIQAYQGHERIGRAARLVLAPVLPRLAAAILLAPIALLIAPGARLQIWSALYALAAFGAAGYALFLVRRDLGAGFRPVLNGLRPALREGWTFAVGGAALKLHADIDKTLLARLSTLEAAGAYSVAYRVADMTMVPLYSLLAAAVPRVFRAGEQGVHHAGRYALRLFPLPLAYTAAVGGVLYFIAGWLPWVLGPGFAPAVEALRWLAWLPLISLPRLFLQVTLIGGDRQGVLAVALSIGGVLNILLNLWAIPRWGWQGAVGATYVAEIVMSGILILSILRTTATRAG
jgi:O-antigen/teichoic acid export membrane protein